MGIDVKTFKNYAVKEGIEFTDKIPFVFVQIDFNSASSFSPDEEDDLEAAIGLRFIFKYVCMCLCVCVFPSLFILIVQNICLLQCVHGSRSSPIQGR